MIRNKNLYQAATFKSMPVILYRLARVRNICYDTPPTKVGGFFEGKVTSPSRLPWFPKRTSGPTSD